MTQYAIRAEGLSKRYRVIRGRRRVLLRDAIQDAISSGWESIAPNSDPEKAAKQTFWALRDVSFEIMAGESIGVIGSNGAGKSTLLKILAHITAPTAGRVHLRGRVGSLLEVGTGFHPELTGRENVYLNGAVLGMRRREINRKFDEIVAFSEVEEFLETPVKFYSTGMRMRLAFSVAAHLEPEILLIDEILAVGDVAFQKKSLGKMDDVVHDGRTVLFVSHNMAAVKALCKKALYIDQGKIRFFGDLEKAVDLYLNTGEQQSQLRVQVPPNPKKPVQILEIGVDSAASSAARLPHDQPVTIQVKLAVRETMYRLGLELSILDNDLNTVLHSLDFEADETRLGSRSPGVYTYNIVVPPILAPGNYRLSIRTRRLDGARRYTRDSIQHVCPFEIYDNGSARSRAGSSWLGKISMPLEWQLVENVSPERV